MSFGSGPTLGGGLSVGQRTPSPTGSLNKQSPGLSCGPGKSCPGPGAAAPAVPASDGNQVQSAGQGGPSGASAAGDMHYLAMPVGTPNCNLPPDPGTSPAPIPGPGAPYSRVVIYPDGFTGLSVEGLSVTDVLTGVTLTTQCGFVTFYYDYAGVMATYNLAGGPGTECGNDPSGNGHTYKSDSHQFFLDPTIPSSGWEITAQRV